MEGRKIPQPAGAYPVISLSFANIKETNFEDARKSIYRILVNVYAEHAFLLRSGVLEGADEKFFWRISVDMDRADAALAVHYLSKFLQLYYGKKVIILLDEYDAPMQEAYVNGYWSELVSFIRSMFNTTFKTNPYLEQAVMTGITRISKEFIFSDLISLKLPYGIEGSFRNNLKVVTTTSDEYGTAFGFTEEEVFDAMDEYGYAQKEEVKRWYDGFTFGK